MHNFIWKNAKNYPPLLNQIKRAPKKLYWRGQELNPEDKYFAVIGTRRPSHYGVQMAKEFTRILAEKGFVIVSGLAFGIDSIAHETALSANGKTIAVLGSGLEKITPVSNWDLAKRIESSGTLITEYEPTFPANKKTFPQRNRIIAGMSYSTLIIEAPEKSGALITARLALEFNRDVFCIPANITQETSKGTNTLIKDSRAFPVTCAQDIFDYMEVGFGKNLQTVKSIPADLSPDEEMIYRLLQISPLYIDEIVVETKLETPQIGVILSMLELKGLVQVSGSYVLTTR